MRVECPPVCALNGRIDPREVGRGVWECGVEGERNVNGVQVARAAVEGPKVVNKKLCVAGLRNVALAEWNNHARHPAGSEGDDTAEKKRGDMLTHG